MASIYGRETYAIDHKGRLSIPADMRRDAPAKKPHSRLFLKFGSEGCLQAYPPQEWSGVEARLREVQKTKGREGREFVRAFLKDACFVTVDAQGRITIPPALLRRAGLGKDAILLGNIDCLEVWSPERIAPLDARGEVRLPDLEDRMLGGGD
jgi:MraZ protein